MIGFGDVNVDVNSFLHQLDSIVVSGLALSLNCNRVGIEVCFRRVCESDEGEDNARARLPYIPVLKPREDGLAVWASNTFTLAIEALVTLLLNAEATDRDATSKKITFVDIVLSPICFRVIMV